MDGLEALNYLETTEHDADLPSLVLLDMNMPILNGKETLQKIRDNDRLRDLQVIMYTSSANPNDKAYFFTQGVATVSKPFSNQHLKKIVFDLLDYTG